MVCVRCHKLNLKKPHMDTLPLLIKTQSEWNNHILHKFFQQTQIFIAGDFKTFFSLIKDWHCSWSLWCRQAWHLPSDQRRHWPWGRSATERRMLKWHESYSPHVGQTAEKSFTPGQHMQNWQEDVGKKGVGRGWIKQIMVLDWRWFEKFFVFIYAWE